VSIGVTAPLESAQVEAAARLLARALHGDPAYAAVFPDAAARGAGLERFFAGHLANHVPWHCSFAHVAEAGGLLGTVTVRPPGGIRVPAARLARGLASLALAVGPGVIRRLLALKNTYEALERRCAGDQPYWHVHMMAVQPELQGKGLGSALLGDALRSTRREPAPIVLTTHEAINVRFYLRAGFRVTHEERAAPAGATPYTVWCMRRDPARASGFEPPGRTPNSP
jgi:GNAT superfamily N-acetyltransferase